MPRFKDFEEEFDAMRSEQRHGRKDRAESGERLSWRDLDRQRDLSPHSDQGKRLDGAQRQGDRYQEAQAAKALKNDLDKLFGDQIADELAEAIIKASDRSTLQSAITAHYEQRGALPANPALLEKALDCRNDKMMRQIIGDIAQHLSALQSVHRTLLLRKMRTKARTTFDRKVSSAINALIDEYGLPD